MRTAKIVVGYGRVLEDRATIIETPAGLAFIVADGVGGIPGGAQAADLAIRTIAEAIEESFGRGKPLNYSGLLEDLDSTIYHDRDAGQTTAVVAFVSVRGVVFGASVGDSGAWIIHDDRYSDLTENQRRKPFLGSGAALVVEFSEPLGGGTLLIATDGLLKYVDAKSICREVRTAEIEEAPERLVNLVKERGGGLWDDVAILVGRGV